MNMLGNKLIEWLFETNALRVSSADNPFWYTSGTIGPYYINTHFLYGNEEKANKLLEFIDNKKDEIYNFPIELTNVMWENYEKDAIYKGVIEQLCTFIKDTVGLDEIDYISGGERRDWFFSFLTAKILGKPHLTIYKDLSITEYNNNHVRKVKNIKDIDENENENNSIGDDNVTNIKGKKVLHITDLVTEASSFERSWIPAVKNVGWNIKWSIAIVDRNQGGKELLQRLGVNLYSIVNIEEYTFEKALKLGLINDAQYKMIIDYINDPKGSMRKFLQENPEFLQKSLSMGGKIAERAKLCIEKKIHF